MKIFQKIRKKLFFEKKAGAYLSYAIGEIILVVIGIFIALQLNNWNEQRKRANLEIKIYKELREDLVETEKEVHSDLNAHIYLIQITDSLINHLVEKKPYNSKIPVWFLRSTSDLQVYPKTSGFAALNSIGLDLLTNDTLRSQVTDLFQLSLTRIVNEGHHEMNGVSFQEILEPYLSVYLFSDTKNPRNQDISIDTDSVVSITRFNLEIRNYEGLLNEPKVVSSLERIQNLRWRKISRHQSTQRHLRRVIKGINAELEVLENK